MAVKIKNGQTILFVGDSITDCGRRDIERPLGNGYVKLFSDFLTIREASKKINIINKGISGNTIRDLKNRWGDDVMGHEFDWLSVKIGINDLHRFLAQVPEGVGPKEFLASYDTILARVIDKYPKCKILLIEPFYISSETSETSFRREVLDILPEYIKIVRQMSRKYKTRLVKTHDMFSKLLKYNEPDVFCPEPIHPNLTGHLAIAEGVYSALSK